MLRSSSHNRNNITVQDLVQDRADLIFFPTALHSGTHSLRHLLELHPKITNPWCRLLKPKGEGDRITALPQHVPGHRLLLHVHPFFDVDEEELDFLLAHCPHAVTSFRDPLAAFVTHYERWGTDPTRHDFIKVRQGFEWIAKNHERFFTFPVDLHQSSAVRTNLCDSMFSYLKLHSANPQMYRFVEEWKVHNKMAEGPYRKAYVENGDASAVVGEWWCKDFLDHADPIRDFVQELGYKLSW
jgi:hypothetical protein